MSDVPYSNLKTVTIFLSDRMVGMDRGVGR